MTKNQTANPSLQVSNAFENDMRLSNLSFGHHQQVLRVQEDEPEDTLAAQIKLYGTV